MAWPAMTRSAKAAMKPNTASAMDSGNNVRSAFASASDNCVYALGRPLGRTRRSSASTAPTWLKPPTSWRALRPVLTELARSRSVRAGVNSRSEPPASTSSCKRSAGWTSPRPTNLILILSRGFTFITAVIDENESACAFV